MQHIQNFVCLSCLSGKTTFIKIDVQAHNAFVDLLSILPRSTLHRFLPLLRHEPYGRSAP